MAGKVLAVACILGMCVPALATDLYARKMEIIRTPEGQVTILRDSVRITDGDTRISAGLVRLNESQGLAVIKDSVFIQSPDALVWADSAFYFLEEKRTELFGNVKVQQESLLILAPMLIYSIPDRQVDAVSGLVVESRTRNLRITGERGSYDLAEEVGNVDLNPVMVQVVGDDTMTVTATEMFWFARESKALAAGRVKVSSGSAELVCDTLVFLTGADSGLAWGEPGVTDSVSHTQGDSISFSVQDGKLDFVTVLGNAASRYTTESGEKIEVSGRAIRIKMEQGEVAMIEIERLLSGRLIRSGAEQEGG